MSSRTSLVSVCSLVLSLGVFSVVLSTILTTPRHAFLLSKSIRPNQILVVDDTSDEIGGVGVLRDANMVKAAPLLPRVTLSHNAKRSSVRSRSTHKAWSSAS